MSFRTTILGFLIFSSPALAVGAESLSPQQPYSAERRNPVDYRVEIVVAVTAPYKTKLLRVWLPIPPSDRGQELLSSELSSFPDEIRPQLGDEPLFGNRFAYFEFRNPQGAQIIRHRFQIKTWELRWNLVPDSVIPVEAWPPPFARYLRSESQAVVSDGRFERLLSEIVPRRRGPLLDLAAVLNWVDGNFTYDHVNASLRASSVHALEQKGGHCSDYHGFCAALGRLMGQPTRVTYGLNAFPKSSPSHCKLEAFLPPHGWVSFDVSETQRLVETIAAKSQLSLAEKEQLVAAARRRLVQGFRDNTWFVQTRGTDYDLVPKASRRVPVVRTIYAEADGKPLSEPDPASSEQTKFSWMTAHRFEADPPVKYPFVDVGSLQEWVDGVKAADGQGD